MLQLSVSVLCVQMFVGWEGGGDRVFLSDVFCSDNNCTAQEPKHPGTKGPPKPKNPGIQKPGTLEPNCMCALTLCEQLEGSSCSVGSVDTPVDSITVSCAPSS